MGKICNVDGNGQCIFEISDPNNHYLVNVTDGDKLVLSRKFYDASIRYKMFVACEFIGYENRYFHTVHRIKIWKLGNPSTLLKTFTQESLERVKLGEQFLLLVRVWDPDSGTYFSDLRLRNEGRSITFVTKIGVNSKFIVICWHYANENELSYLSIYDLQAIKNTNSDPSRHLLYTLEVPLDVQRRRDQ